MAICVDITTSGFKALKEQTKGLSSFQLQVIVSDYIEKFGRYPELDELPNNSEEAFFAENSLKDAVSLDVTENPVVSLKANTRTNNTVKLSNELLQSKLENEGLEWKITKVQKESESKDIKEGEDPQVNEEVIYELTMENSKHPLSTIANALSKKFVGLMFYNPTFDGESFTFNYYKLPNSFIETEITETPIIRQSTLGDVLDIIRNKFNINIHRITDLELASDKWNGIRPKNRVVKAFIYNGEIYINIDHASVKDPIHEIFHIFMGALHQDTFSSKGEKTTLLQSILDSIELTDEDYKIIQQEGFTEMDYKEELIVDNVAKYLTGEQSIFSDGKNADTLKQLSKGITKVLGLSKNFDLETIQGNQSIQSIMTELGSLFGKVEQREESIGNAFTHRMINNSVKDVLKSNNLEVTQKCE